MAISTATLVWLYHVVNGKEELAHANGHAPNGNAKRE